MERKQQKVSLNKLFDHPNNPRKNLNVDELMESIKDVGQLSPLLVRSINDGYQIISGHRRKAALLKAEQSEALCDIVVMDDEQAFKALMVANIQAQSLSEIEEAEGIRRMMDEFEWTQERVAKEFGKKKMWISRRLSLLELNPLVQESVSARILTPTHAREIAQAPQELQPAIADKVVKEDLSTRETEALVKVLKDDSIPSDLKQKVIESPNIKPEAVVEVAKIPDPEVREKVTAKLERDIITPTEIKKIAQDEEIKQAAKEVRNEVISKYEAEGTKPPVKTDDEMILERNIIVAENFMSDLRQVNSLVQPHPNVIEKVISSGKSNIIVGHLDHIIRQINNLRQHLIVPQTRKSGDGKIIEFPS